MKILLLADEAEPMLWDHLDRRRLEGVELILSCGDLPASYLSYLTCFTTAPILYIHGNHDTRYALHPPEGCICVEDSLFVYKGIRIAGFGGCMRYKPGPMQYTEKQMMRRIKKLKFRIWLHGGVDILLTHAPAYQLGDAEDRCHTGFQCFRSFMEKYKPVIMAHGHVHKSYSSSFKRTLTYDETLVVNACGSYTMEVERKK